MNSGTSRREFLKKAGVAAGLGAAGAATLKKEYVKPVVKFLEPSSAYAQTPVMSGAIIAPTSPHNIAANPAYTVRFNLISAPGPLAGVLIDVANTFQILADPSNAIKIALQAAGAVSPGSNIQWYTLGAVATSAADGRVDLLVNAAVVPATLNGVSMNNPAAATNTDTYPGTGIGTLATLGGSGASGFYTMGISTEPASVGGINYPATFLGNISISLTTL